jgi:multidrug resistance efflux pump
MPPGGNFRGLTRVDRSGHKALVHATKHHTRCQRACLYRHDGTGGRGGIAELTVGDNKYVRKGDLLMVIDPTNYGIAVSQAEAAVQQAQASVQTTDAQLAVQQAQISTSQAQLDQADAALVFAQQQALRYQDLAQKGAGTIQNAQQFTAQLSQQEAAVKSAQANLELAQRQTATLKAQRLSGEAALSQARAQLHQAQVNLERTRIVSPVNGYVTNLLAHPGNYVNVGVNTISVVDADSFWVDGYFEETNLAPIRVGDLAQIKLMGYDQIIRGHVDSVARAINVSKSMFRTRNPIIRGWPWSTQSSPGYASPNAFRFASISTRCRRTSSFRPV